jgi:hypothetical protein
MQRYYLLKVHVKLKDSDYLEFCQYQLTHSRQGKRTLILQRIMLPLISLAMIAAFIVFHASTKALIIEIVSLGLASAIWVIGAPGMLKRSMQRDFYKKKNSGRLPFRETSVLEFGEEGITEISGSHSDTTPYSSITSIVKSDDRLFVYTDGNNGFVIPFNDAAKNGRKVARLLSQKTGLEVEEESADK